MVRKGGSFRGLLGGEAPRSGRALARGGAESSEGGVGHRAVSPTGRVSAQVANCEFTTEPQIAAVGPVPPDAVSTTPLSLLVSC
jgi:hypothetical protein